MKSWRKIAVVLTVACALGAAALRSDERHEASKGEVEAHAMAPSAALRGGEEVAPHAPTRAAVAQAIASATQEDGAEEAGLGPDQAIELGQRTVAPFEVLLAEARALGDRDRDARLSEIDQQLDEERWIERANQSALSEEERLAFQGILRERNAYAVARAEALIDSLDAEEARP